VVGEVSLTGEVRPVPGMEKRVRACRDLGYGTVVGPAEGAGPGVTPVPLIREAVRVVFGGKESR
jgi:predicted ATP-dependent serine protease